MSKVNAAKMDVSDVEYGSLPDRLRDGVRLYIEQGVVTGSFLTALFENDLHKAVCAADETNLFRLREIVIWLRNEAPAQCHGSWARVEHWKRMGGALGVVRIREEEEDHDPI